MSYLEGQPLDHYIGLYDHWMTYERHNVQNIRSLYGTVLLEFDRVYFESKWKFWKLYPYMAFIHRIERDHAQCCNIHV